MPSIFSRIIAGELPGSFIFTDAQWVGLVDIMPAAPGHALLIPRHEAAYLADLPAPVLAGLGERLARLTAVVKAVTTAPAVNVILNDGPEAGQAVPHAHLHIIPRFPNDKVLRLPKGQAYAAGEMARLATALRAAWG